MEKVCAIWTAIGLCLVLSLPVPVHAAGDALLCWDRPWTNDDGTPLTDLAGYKVYEGTAPGTYGNPVDVGNTQSKLMAGLSETTHYFAVTAYDDMANESIYSNEVSKLITTLPVTDSCNACVICATSGHHRKGSGDGIKGRMEAQP